MLANGMAPRRPARLDPVRRLNGQIAWLVAIFLFGATACGRRSPQPPLRFSSPPADQASNAQDPSFGGTGSVTARHFQIREKLLVPQIDAFARLTPAQREHLERLQAQAWLNTRVYALDDRALIIPPSRHPAGTLELLLCWDRNQLVVFSQDRWAYDLPLSALPDVLDRARPSRRDVAKGSLVKSVQKPPRRTSPTRAHILGRRDMRMLVNLRYWPRQRKDQPWALNVQLALQLPLVAPQSAGSHAVFPLILPLLQTHHGRLVSESLALEAGLPRAWVRTVANETFGGFVSPSFAHSLEDKGTVELPIQRFSSTREGFRRASRIGDPQAGGAQGIEPQELDPLGSGQPGAELHVDNQSALSAVVYIDGVPVGWVATGKSFTFKGPRHGYYRVYAAAPTGARAWGPYDMYLSGPLVLR